MKKSTVKLCRADRAMPSLSAQEVGLYPFQTLDLFSVPNVNLTVHLWAHIVAFNVSSNGKSDKSWPLELNDSGQCQLRYLTASTIGGAPCTSTEGSGFVVLNGRGVKC